MNLAKHVKIDNEDFIWKYRAKVVRVVDGDTYELLIDLGFNILLKRNCRLYGVNTAEIHGEERPKGLQVKKFVIDLIEGKDITILSPAKDDKYGRVLAKIVLPDGTDLAETLLAEGMAKEYFGEGPKLSFG